MKPELLLILAIFMFFVLLEIVFTRFFSKPGQTKGDGIVEIASTGMLSLITQPLVLFSAGAMASLIIPELKNAIADYPFWLIFLLFLLLDDLTQYWWHRMSHSVKWLYNLHRPHHNASYLSIRVVYRNNFFYYLLMPGLWLSGLLIYLGGGWVYAVYIVIKMTVIFGAHSDVRWDKPLYEIAWLSPLMWVLERVISTPATHSAHHGKYLSDAATHYKGNYGNLLFFWDVLFGTAKITRKYPQEFGVENLPKTSIAEQLVWPLAKAKR
jgi:sterol desaturase/sphingolipid hydroxylase (fatty acid hydroxylase superfamily)